MRLGIDAVNIRAGGGVTHLIELLAAIDPREFGFSQVTVWATRATLDQLSARPWLSREYVPMLEKGLFSREYWRRYYLERRILKDYDVLFVPGGLYAGKFKPVISMSQNLLPFEDSERRRFGISVTRFRLELLKWGQTRTFQRSQGVVFLTKSARDVVGQSTGSTTAQKAIIPHGISPRFTINRAELRDTYTIDRPFRWLYVSIVNLYKHQWNVIDAIVQLQKCGIPVELHLVGSAHPQALKRLKSAMEVANQNRSIVHYHGLVPYTQIDALYRSADGFVFASSCENMPNILLEGMAAGLPIACSDKPVMREVLGESGIYFDPEDPDTIAKALLKIMSDAELRQSLAISAHEQALIYSWKKCARETFRFISIVGEKYRRKNASNF